MSVPLDPEARAVLEDAAGGRGALLARWRAWLGFDAYADAADAYADADAYTDQITIRERRMTAALGAVERVRRKKP